MKSIVHFLQEPDRQDVDSRPGRAAKVLWAIAPAISWLVALAAGYMLVAALIREDRAGFRVLHVFAPVVNGLRWLGWTAERAGKVILMDNAPLVAGGTLLLIFAGLLFLFRRRGNCSWRRAVGLALSGPAFAASALLFGMGSAWGGATAGLLAGVALLDQAAATDSPPQRTRLLWLVPVGLGFLLRLYALSQIPNGYAEHAAVQHAQFSIPYMEALLASARSLNPQPFASQAWNALLREHSGPFTLVDSIGFAVFGVSLLVSRIVSALIGTLTIYVAYLLGSELKDARLGLIFSFLIAVSPWNITISRYGTAEHVLSPFQLLVALLFLVRAVRRGGFIDGLLAAVVTAFSWIIYAPNIVVPLLAACLLIFQATRDPKAARQRMIPAALAFVCFLLVSYALLSKSFPQGLFQPNIRTGYLGSGPLLSNWPKRLEMLGNEVNQLLVHASDPWFGLPAGGGLGILEATLLLPGILLSAKALRDRTTDSLGLLVVVGIPLGILPAVFAPDASFRRLAIVAALGTLAASFAVYRLVQLLHRLRLPRALLTGLGVAAALLVTAGSTFTYFDRVVAGEDVNNAWFGTLVSTAIENLGDQPVIVVTPRRNQHDDIDRYMRLMAYDTLLDAQADGIPQGDLYLVTSCEDPVGAGGRSQVGQPAVIVAARDIFEFIGACTPQFLADLTQHYEGATLINAAPAALPADLAPAPR